jgi:hypothetical protein
MIFCQSWGKPGYGTNAGLVQGLTPGPHHIQWTGRYFLSVPGPLAAPLERRATLDLVDQPQGAGRHPDQTERMSADDALPLTALLLPQSSEGVGVANGHFHRPAVAILVQDLCSAQRQSGGEAGFEDWGGVLGPGRWGAGGPCRRSTTPRTRRPGNTACPRPSQAWISAPASLGWGDHSVAVWARVVGEPIRAPFWRGAPRRLGLGGGGTS